MALPRRRFLASSLPVVFWAAGASAAPEPAAAKLGVLLDTSAEMGFLVPQARMELRLLNEQLAASGRLPVELREMEGASIDREGPSMLPARRNAYYALRSLYDEVDTVLWITSLRGEQSSHGLHALEELLQETVPDRLPRHLVVRNVWQEQLLAGEEWVRHPPPLGADPLEPRNRPEEWYRLLDEGRGRLIRSWQVPPPDYRAVFGFPPRVAGTAYLRKLGQEGGEAFFDQAWSLGLLERHGLRFVGAKEEWLPRFTGRRWVEETALLPYPDEAARRERSERVFAALCARGSVAEDLDRIEANKLGVVFGFGYVAQDLKRHFANEERPPRNWRERYLDDLVRIGAECARQREADADHPSRVYAIERVELAGNRSRPEPPDPILRSVARMAREESCDAVYLLTNGYLGGGDYGTWGLDLQLLARAVRERGVRLYVRIPFEFGPVPIAMAQLAMASGGGVLRPFPDDPDWRMALPEPFWPEEPEAGP